MRRRQPPRALRLAILALAVGAAGAALAVEASAALGRDADGLCGIAEIVDRLLCAPPRAPTAGPPASTPTPGGTADQPTAPAALPMPRYDPNRILVTVKRGARPRDVEALFDEAGVREELAIPELRVRVAWAPAERRDQALSRLRSSSLVAAAEREVLLDALETSPNDAAWPAQSGLRLIGLPRAWDVTRGSASVVVAVLDTGVDGAHRDLQGALLPGWDFVNGDADATDDHGHGTAVAGILAARTNNREGIAGVCWVCPVLPVKVLDAKGSGTTSLVAAGIVWAVDHGARVLNMSLGGPGTTDVLGEAVAYAAQQGAILVAAAGNDGVTVPFYPAAESATVAVAATDLADRLYPWSNRGAWVRVAAPGCNLATVTGGYGEFCGTSSATPVVAGLAALALSARPRATREEVLDALGKSAVAVEGGLLNGRIDALGTLRALPAAASDSGGASNQAAVTTATFRGAVGPRTHVRRYRLTIGAGQVTARLVFSRARTLSLSILAGPSRTVRRVSGRSPLRLVTTVPAGTIELAVRGDEAATTSFTLEVSHPVPRARRG